MVEHIIMFVVVIVIGLFILDCLFYNSNYFVYSEYIFRIYWEQSAKPLF